MSTMNVLICQQPKELVWKQREIPIPGDNEALIKIKSVGICGTDIHAWGGNQPFFSYPRVLGHEICGEVVGLGKNVADLKNGQQVAVIPYVACQQCPACKSGRTNCCEKISVIGVHQDGLVHISALSNTFVKDPHTVVKAGQVVRVKVLEVDEKRKRIALTMRLTDSAPQAGSKPEQKGDRNDRRSMAQHQSQSRNAPEPAGSMAAAFAKLRG